MLVGSLTLEEPCISGPASALVLDAGQAQACLPGNGLKRMRFRQGGNYYRCEVVRD